MSKRYNIRWNQYDSEQLRRAVKNFNAKISRLEKKDPKNKSALPEKVTVKQMRELIDTRQDLKRELNALQRFSRRGSEELVDVPESKYNLKITKWQKEEMSRRVGVINRKRKKKLKEIAGIELKSRGEELGYTRGAIGMGRMDEVALYPIRAFTPAMNRQDVRKKYSMILKESQAGYWDKKDIILKENYIRSLESNFNPKDIADVKEKIMEMDHKKFRKIFESEGGNFELSYPPDDDSYQAYLSAIKAIWNPKKAGK